MISKILAGRSFSGSIRYICQDQQRAEVLRTEGVRAYDYRLMIQDFSAQAALNPAKRRACFHGILSFYPCENVSNKTMVAIAERFLKKVGITDTQYAITKHSDKAHPHLHIIANMVANNGRSIKDNWIGYRAMKVAQELTQEYGLKQALKKNLALINLDALHPSEVMRYKIYGAIQEVLPHCSTLDVLEVRLKAKDIEVKYRHENGTTEKQGISFRLGNYSFKGSQVDRGFSLGNLEKTFRLQQQQLMQQENRAGQKREVPDLLMKQTKKNVSGYLLSARGLHSDSRSLINGDKGIGNLLRPAPSSEPVPYPVTQHRAQHKKKKVRRISR